MRIEEREALARKADEEAARDPRAYRRRVLRQVILGYGYVVACVAGVAAAMPLVLLFVYLSHNYGVIKLVVIAEAALGWQLVALVRALWPKKALYPGVVVDRAQAAGLFAVLDDLRAKLGVPAVAEVRVMLDANAYAARSAKGAVVGVGVPLLAAMPPDEMRAVLAHELGHLWSGDDHFAGRVARLRTTWAHLFATDGGVHGRLGWMLGPLAKRIVPAFEASSRAMARVFERQADARAVQAAGEAASARALVRTTLVVARLTDLKRIAAKEIEEREEPRTVAELVVDVAATPAAAAEEERVLRVALQTKAAPQDAHPSLAERIALAGGDASMPPPVEEGASALDAWHLRGVLALFPAKMPKGRAREGLRAELTTRRERRAELEQSTRRTPEEDVELARLMLAIDGDAVRAPALALLQGALDRGVDDAELELVVGAGLMEEERYDDAVRYLERAARARAHAGEATGALLQIAERRGDVEGEQRHKRRLSDLHEEDERALAERARMRNSVHSVGDHDLPADVVAACRASLEANPHVKAAWLAQYKLQHRPDQPLYLVAVKPKGGLTIGDPLAQLVHQIDLGGRPFYLVKQPPTVVKSLPRTLLFQR